MANPILDKLLGKIRRSDDDPTEEMIADEEFRRSVEREAKRRAKREAIEQKQAKAEEKEAARLERRKAQQEATLKAHQERVHAMAEQLGFDPNRPVLELPPIPEGMREIERTIIEPERALVRILYDEIEHEHIYEVIEPELTTSDRETMEFLRDTLERTMAGWADDEIEDWPKYIGDALREAVADHEVIIDSVSLQRVEYYLLRDFLGYGPMDAFMRDAMIEDISCDAPRVPIYIFHRKYESIRSTVKYASPLALDSFVIRLAQQSGKHISIANPLLDATLPDGSRLQATLSTEVTTRGSSFTIRKFRSEPMSPIDLIGLGSVSVEMAAYFWFLMDEGSSLLMAGGTASGKTTTLNAACQFIPPEKKIVSIEDTREINLQHDNWIAGVTREGFGESSAGIRAGGVDMFALLGAALRQRPEYLLVGEVRGKEAVTLFQAMATGHAVYSTMHADSVPSAVYRLENEPINVPRLMLQTLDVVAIQSQVRINNALARRVTDVTEIVGFDPETGDVLTNSVFTWDPATDTHRYLGKSHALEKRMRRQNIKQPQLIAEWADRIEVLSFMQREGIRNYRDVSKVLTKYYRDKENLLKLVYAPPGESVAALGLQPDAESPTVVAEPEPVEQEADFQEEVYEEADAEYIDEEVYEIDEESPELGAAQEEAFDETAEDSVEWTEEVSELDNTADEELVSAPTEDPFEDTANEVEETVAEPELDDVVYDESPDAPEENGHYHFDLADEEAQTPAPAPEPKVFEVPQPASNAWGKRRSEVKEAEDDEVAADPYASASAADLMRIANASKQILSKARPTQAAAELIVAPADDASQPAVRKAIKAPEANPDLVPLACPSCDYQLFCPPGMAATDCPVCGAILTLMEEAPYSPPRKVAPTADRTPTGNCEALTKSRRVCKNRAVEGSHYCRRHQPGGN